MSSPLDKTNSWGLLKGLAGKVNGKNKLTDAELKKILKVADKNADGLIELNEYKNAFFTLDEYSNLEDEFLESFEAIAKIDGNEKSISETDITNAIEELKKLEHQSESTQSSSGSSSYSGSSSPKNNDNQTADLTSKDFSTLKSERSQILSDISSKRSEKEQAVAAANIDVSSKQTAYNNATKTFQDLVKQKMESQQTTNEYAQDVVAFEDQKNTFNAEISAQEGLINASKSTISTLRSDLSSLSEPPETISYTNEETQETETKDNPAYQQYIDRQAALEEEISAAEIELAKQEEKLETLKTNLKSTEDSLQNAIVKYVQIEEESGSLTEAEITAKESIDSAKDAYDEACGQIDEIESNFDKEINAFQEQLIAYDDAMASSEEKVDVKSGTFGKYLEENGVDASKVSESEMDSHLKEYMNNKYGESNIEEYYPTITEEQLSQYIGDGGLAALEEVDKTSVQNSITKILTDDTLTPFQQIQLLNTIKAHSDEAKSYLDKSFKEDDSYFYSQLEKMTTSVGDDNKPLYTNDDVLEFVRQYKALDSSSTVLNLDSNIQTVLTLYENAENNEQLSELNSYLNASVVAGLIQENYTEDVAQEHIATLFKASSTNMLTTDGKFVTNPEDYKLTEDDVSLLQQTYINHSGSTLEKVQRVLSDLNKGSIDKASAQYVVSSLMGANPENISSLSGVNSKDTVLQLFSLFETKPYQAFGNGVEFDEPIYVKDGDYQYGLIAPKNVDPNEELPLIVFLPGGGEYKGGSFATVGTHDRNGNGKIDKNDYKEYKDNAIGNIVSDWDLQDFNGYIIVPTLNDSYIPNWFNENAEKYVRGVVESFQENHTVNKDMIFVGGHSLGGQGALYMAEHVDDIFSKAFVMSGYADEVGRYDVNNISIPMIGYVGRSNSGETSDSGYMDSFFRNKVGDENLVKIKRAHGKVPINAFRLDADGDRKSDLIEWLLEGQEIPENSDEY